MMRGHPPEADMRELPKFVVDRLKVPAPSAGHPDADVLTAFAERSMPASERALVLEHLARCGDCRDVVALALPAPAVHAKEVVEPAGAGLRSWWRWPVLRGAAVAAAVIAVVAVGIYQYQHRAPANVIVARSEESNQVAAPPAPNETETAAPRAETVAPPAETRREAAPPPSRLFAGKSPSNTADALGWRAKSTGVAAGASGGIVAGAGPAQGTKMAMAEPPRDLAFAPSPQAPSAQTTKQIPAPSPPRRDAPPAVSQTVEVQGEAKSVTVEAQAPTQLNTQTAELRAPTESAEDKVRRAKPPATVSGATPVAVSPTFARNQLDLQQGYQTSTPHWTISSAGILQRSLDGGKTWQDVNVMNVTAKPGLYAGSMQMANVSNDRESKKVAKKLANEKAAKPETAPTPIFRAVAAIGNEVWAGASGGLLYHSADAGTLWTSIILSTQGVTLSGDIIRIEFSDPLHGKITTSTSETWTTADGGQSWQKQ